MAEKTQKKIKEILAVRNDRLGEFLLNIPAFRALKESYPGAMLTVVVNPAISEITAMIPYIDSVIEWGQGRHSILEKLSMAASLRKKKYDLAVMLNPSRDFNLITFLAGIPVRVGYDRKLGFLLNRKIKDRKYLGDKHEIDYNLGLAKLAGASTQDNSLSLAVEDDIINGLFRENLLHTADCLVALHPWTSDPVKQWPLDRFRDLAQRLTGIPAVKVVIVGAKPEEPESAALFSGLRGKVIDLTGKTSLKQLAGLLKKCRLLISADSGPVHVASCVGTAVVALFRNDIPAKGAVRWGPRNPGSVVIQKPRLQDIDVDEVFNAVKTILKI